MRLFASCATSVVVVVLLLALPMRIQCWATRALGLPYGDARLWQSVGSMDWAQIEPAVAEGADINACNPWGNTLLVVAASTESPRLVREVLRCGGDPNQANAMGMTPLASAVLFERVEIAELLVRAGADPNAPGSERESPLIAALRIGNRDLVDLLLDAGADLDAPARGKTALTLALEFDRPDLPALLRVHGAGRHSGSAGASHR